METGRGASHGRLGRSTLAVLCVGFLGGCGGGGSAPQSPTAPPVTTISLAPSSVTTGQSSVLTWSSTGASECSASGAWTGSVATSGTQNVSQATPGSYSYVVTCSGAGGSTANSAALTVDVPAPVVSIAVSPASIATDHTATLTWSATNATSCVASGSWSGPQAVSGSTTVANSTPGSYTYALSCSNVAKSASNSAVLTVAPPQQLNTTLTASQGSIAAGQTITLTWSSEGADSCTASGGWTGKLAASGSQSVNVASGINYYNLQCANATGDGNAQVTVQGLVATATLSANPTTTGAGQPTTLTWSSTEASSCTASGEWSGTLASSGSQVVTPGAVGNHAYSITCGNPGAPAQANVSVTASIPIVTLSVFPNTVVAGKTVTLRWQGQYADTCTASGAWSGSLSASGYMTVTAGAAGTESFQLACSNVARSVSADASVTVNAAPVSPPATAYRMTEAHDGVLITSNGIGYPTSSTPTWTVNLGAPVSYPLIAGGKVFVATANPDQSYGNRLYALDAATGATVWGPVAVSGTYFGSGLTYDSGRVFILMFDGALRAFNASNGAALWTTQLPGYWYEASPNAYGGEVFIVGNGGLTAVDEATGNILWTNGSAGSTDWDSPAISSEGAYVQSGGCAAGAYLPLTGTPIWQVQSQCNGGWGYASILGDDIFFGRASSTLTLFDPASGTQIAQLASQLAPAITSTAVIALNAGTLSSTRLSDRVQTWTFTGDGHLVTAPVVVNNTVLIGSSSGNVYGLDAATGTQVWMGVSPQPISNDSENGGPMPPSGPAAGENLLVFLAGNTVVAWKFQ